MSTVQKICFFYFAALMVAASLNYIPGLTDDQGLAFGIFALDLYDDALHVASALWALIAGLRSRNAARLYFMMSRAERMRQVSNQRQALREVSMMPPRRSA